MRIKTMSSVAQSALWGWWNDNCMRLSASLAFYTALSLAPLVVIVVGVAGLITERQQVTAVGEVVWEYVNPFFSDDERFGCNNTVFRAYRYAPDFPGLRGKTWHPEAYAWLNHLYAEL